MCENAASHAKDELHDACEALKRAASLFHTIDQLAQTAGDSAALRELARLGFEQTANATKEAEWVLHQTVNGP